MTDPVSTTTPLTVDPQDPLPESNWGWRRAFIFASTIAIMAFIWLRTDNIADLAYVGNQAAVTGLVAQVRYATVTLGCLFLLYLVAPSAEQVVKMLATLSAWKSGVSTRTESSASDGSGARATASATAGPSAASPLSPSAPSSPSAVPTNDPALPWRKVDQ